jgi:hypothetical protein
MIETSRCYLNTNLQAQNWPDREEGEVRINALPGRHLLLAAYELRRGRVLSLSVTNL